MQRNLWQAIRQGCFVRSPKSSKNQLMIRGLPFPTPNPPPPPPNSYPRQTHAVLSRFVLLSAVKSVQNDHPLVKTKAVLVVRWSRCILAGFQLWTNQCPLSYNERLKGWPERKKNHKDHYPLSKREKAKVGFSAWALLAACPQTFVRELPQMTALDRYRHTVAVRRWQPGGGAWKNPVAICSAVSEWNGPCTKKRSLEADGRYSRWSLKPGFTALDTGIRSKQRKTNMAGPLDLSFWAFLTLFFASWYSKSREAFNVKIS